MRGNWWMIVRIWVIRKKATSISRKELERNISLGKQYSRTQKASKLTVLKRMSTHSCTTIEHSCTCISVRKSNQTRAKINNIFFSENFGRAIDDCKSALKQDDKFIKAYFRKAQVESTLRRYEDSLITCLTALQYEPENREVLALRTDIERSIEIENSKKRSIT